MSHPPKKRPYLSPRVLVVQERMSGDNLAPNCKTGTEDSAGGGGETCEFNDACFDVGS